MTQLAPTQLAPGQLTLCDPGPPLAPPTAARLRTERARRQLVLGLHPAGIAFDGLLYVHREAPPPGDRAAAGPRCGGCVHRRLASTREGNSRPKCLHPEHAYTPGVRGPDVPAWWPGCEHWQPDQPGPGSGFDGQ